MASWNSKSDSVQCQVPFIDKILFINNLQVKLSASLVDKGAVYRSAHLF
jgi:hypothetical protein